MRTPLHYWRLTDKFGSARFTWKLHRIYDNDSIERPLYVGSPLFEALKRKMVVCETCGNKRCPRANNPANLCTNSNARGQAGSSYP